MSDRTDRAGAHSGGGGILRSLPSRLVKESVGLPFEVPLIGVQSVPCAVAIGGLLAVTAGAIATNHKYRVHKHTEDAAGLAMQELAPEVDGNGVNAQVSFEGLERYWSGRVHGAKTLQSFLTVRKQQPASQSTPNKTTPRAKGELEFD